MRTRFNTPILHSLIKTWHISFFYVDSYFKMGSPTRKNYSKNLHLLKTNLEQTRFRERERETEEEH